MIGFCQDLATRLCLPEFGILKAVDTLICALQAVFNSAFDLGQVFGRQFAEGVDQGF